MLPLSTYIKYGAGLGLAGGFVSSCYFLGESNKPSINLVSDIMAPVIAATTLFLGPMAGASTGASVYFSKKAFRHLQNSSKPIQLTAAITVASLIVGKMSYDNGRRE